MSYGERLTGLAFYIGVARFAEELGAGITDYRRGYDVLTGSVLAKEVVNIRIRLV